MEVRGPTLAWIPIAVVVFSILSELASMAPGVRWSVELTGVGLWIILWRRQTQRNAPVTNSENSVINGHPGPIEVFIKEVANVVELESRGAEEEVARVRGLLGEAVSTLVENFTELSRLSAEQSTIVAEIVLNHDRERNRILPERTNKVGEISEQLNCAVGIAVRSLQFEDIAIQALRTADKHIDHLIQLSFDLRNLESAAADQHIQIGHNEVIERLRARVVERREDWSKQSAKPVSQTSMSAGGVDLF